MGTRYSKYDLCTFIHHFIAIHTQHNSTHHRARIIMCVRSPIKSLPSPSYSFVVEITSAVGFIMASLFLRATEGIGSAMFTTSAHALIPKLFPNHITIVVVSHIIIKNSYCNSYLQGLFRVACGVGYSSGYILGGVLYQVMMCSNIRVCKIMITSYLRLVGSSFPSYLLVAV